MKEKLDMKGVRHESNVCERVREVELANKTYTCTNGTLFCLKQKLFGQKYIFMTKCVLTNIASVVKTVEHFINSKRPKVVPERQRFISQQVKLLYHRVCIIIFADYRVRE